MREAGIDVDGKGAGAAVSDDEFDAEAETTILETPLRDELATTEPALRVAPARPDGARSPRKRTEVRVEAADPLATTLPGLPRPRRATKKTEDR
jgi:hypothetical protein